jgi:DNA-binding transcriptional LysR family regulator
MPNLTLDLRYLRCALSAAEFGSFRRAASALGLPQSTVSRRVQLLERRLGFPVFLRDNRGARLTAAGANFLKEAVLGADQLSRAARVAVAIHRGDRGELRVGNLAPLSSGFLHSMLRRFRERYPDVQVHLKEATSLETLHGLATGQLDISFITGRPDVQGYVAQVLWTESVFAVLPASHPLSQKEILLWEDLREEVFLVTVGGPGSEIYDYLLSRLSRPGFRPKVEVHEVSRESLMDLVAMGYGIALISTSSLRDGVPGVSFHEISGEEGALSFSAVWSATNSNPALRNLLGLAQLVAGAGLGSQSRRAAQILKRT